MNQAIHQVDILRWLAGPVKEVFGMWQIGALHKIESEDVVSSVMRYENGATGVIEASTAFWPGYTERVEIHGTKGTAIISIVGHSPAQCRTFRGQDFAQKDMLWSYPSKEPDPYQVEWEDLMEAIRDGKPYNEVRRGAEASLITAMGRMAAHTGQTITRDEMLNCTHEFAPDVDKLTLDSPAPLLADKDGKYPVPMPGMKKKREF